MWKRNTVLPLQVYAYTSILINKTRDEADGCQLLRKQRTLAQSPDESSVIGRLDFERKYRRFLGRKVDRPNETQRC